MGEQAGLYDKYVVSRRDASDVWPDGRHFGCRYFVLDLTHDEDAVEAALWYARRRGNTRLEADLRALPDRQEG